MFGSTNELWDIIRDPSNGYLNEFNEFTASAVNRFVQDRATVRENLLLLRPDGSDDPTRGRQGNAANT